jgi:hypothetical protein
MVTVIFGGGKIDITDRPDRTLGQLNVNSNLTNITDLLQSYYKVTLDGYKLLATDSSISKINVIRIIPKICILEINNHPLIGCLAKNNIVEIDGIVHRVNDVRHSQQLDYEDGNTWSTTSTSYVVFLQYDYGSVYTFKQVYIKYYASGYATVRAEYSTDNVNFTALFETHGDITTDYLATNISFRYLRFLYKSDFSSNTAYAKVLKIILTR